MKKHQHPTAVWRNGECSASYDSFVVGSSSVLRLKFSGENRHLRKAANRCAVSKIKYEKSGIRFQIIPQAKGKSRRDDF